MARLGAEVEDVGDGVPRVGEVVDGVGVVPEQAEVRRGRRHRRQAPHHGLGVDVAARVRIARDAPHALDRRIGGDKPLDLVHVGAVAGERHRDHAHAVGFADRKMAIVARHRAQERRPRLAVLRGLAPRPLAAGHALKETPEQTIVHEREGGIVAGDDLRRRCTEDRGEERARLGQPLQIAVIAPVLAGLARRVAIAGQRQHRLRQRQLIRCRLAARHVQLQLARTKRLVVGARALVKRGEAIVAGVVDAGHLRCSFVRRTQSRSCLRALST